MHKQSYLSTPTADAGTGITKRMSFKKLRESRFGAFLPVSSQARIQFCHMSDSLSRFAFPA